MIQWLLAGLPQNIDDRLAAEIVEKREARRGTRQQEKEAAKWLTTPDKT